MSKHICALLLYVYGQPVYCGPLEKAAYATCVPVSWLRVPASVCHPILVWAITSPSLASLYCPGRPSSYTPTSLNQPSLPLVAVNLLFFFFLLLTPVCPPTMHCSWTLAGRPLRLGPAGPRSGWWTPWVTLSLSLLTPGSSLHAWYVPSCLPVLGLGLLVHLCLLHD